MSEWDDFKRCTKCDNGPRKKQCDECEGLGFVDKPEKVSLLPSPAGREAPGSFEEERKDF